MLRSACLRSPNYVVNTVDPHGLLVAMGTDITVHMGFVPGTSTICQWADLEPLERRMTHHPDATAWVICVCSHGQTNITE